MGDSSTRLEISHYYTTKSLKAKILNFLAGRKIASDTQKMLNAVKSKIEDEHSGGR